MRRFCVLFAVIAAVGLLVVPARASIWTDGISYDGLVDVIQDNSVSLALLDTGPTGSADGIVSVGDVIAGVVKWNLNIADSRTIGDHSLAVFAAQVTGVSGAGPSIEGDPTINFSVGAAPGVLDILLPTISGTVSGFEPSALGVILSHVGGADPTTLALGAALGLIDSTYAPDLIFGFKTAADYFEAALRDHRIAAGGLGADGVISIGDADTDGYANEWDDVAGPGPGLAIFPGIGVTGRESGGFSVLRDFTGPGPGSYLLLPTTKIAGGFGPGSGLAQLILAPSTELFQPTAAQAANHYIFADQSVIALNAIPEPASMLVWAGLAGLFGFMVVRRRRSA